MNLDWLTDEVLRRLRTQLPSALLLGELPEPDGRFFYVHEPPYEQVVIGLLLPDELLQMPTRPVCDALLQGLPVWIWPQRCANRAIGRPSCSFPAIGIWP